MKCKFCGCSDEHACAIPMIYGAHPLGLGPSPFDYEELPVIALANQVAEFTTPCHWSAPSICSNPACIEKAYAETCTMVDEILGACA